MSKPASTPPLAHLPESRRSTFRHSTWSALCLMVMITGLGACGDSGTQPNQETPSNDPAAVQIQEGNMRLLVGNECPLSASVFTASGTPLPSATVTWSTNAEAVATVDASGTVRAVGAGQALITATAGSAAASVTVTVPEPTGTVSASGGTIQAASGQVNLNIPANAVAAEVAITAVPAASDSLPDGQAVIAGTAYEFGPAGLTFAAPVTLTLTYDPGLASQAEARRLRVHKLVGATWTPLAGSTVDTAAHQASGEISSFSIYAVAAVPNQPPVVTISAPADGSSFDAGTAVEFTGVALDSEDGTIPGDRMVWESSVDGGLGSGASLTRSDLSLGQHVVSLTATDADGASATAHVTLTVSDGPPSVQITQPTDGSAFKVGTAVTFQGTATDNVDGTLSGASLVWASSIDGQLGTGTSLTTSSLSLGEHTVTLTATDSGGNTGSASISVGIRPNEPPVVTISSPANGSEFAWRSQITFTGSATDAEDGALTGGRLAWTSSLDGALGTGGSVTAGLSVGQHTVTLEATDTEGGVGRASVTVTVLANRPPSVSISRPTDGEEVPDQNVIFQGSADDPEEGALQGSKLMWTSSIDGHIGEGTGFTLPSITVGTHFVTLRATDSDGAEGTDTVTFTVYESAPDLPAPELVWGGMTAEGHMLLHVNNTSDYNESLFVLDASLPPCGLNTNAGRTWVAFYDQRGSQIYGYCALTDPDDMSTLTVLLSPQRVLPEEVYVELWDRATDRRIQSNRVAVPAQLIGTIEWPYNSLERSSVPPQAVIEMFYNGYYNADPCGTQATYLGTETLSWGSTTSRRYDVGNDGQFEAYVHCAQSGVDETLSFGVDGVTGWAVEESRVIDTGSPDLLGRHTQFIELVVDRMEVTGTEGAYTVHLVMRWNFYGN